MEKLIFKSLFALLFLSSISLQAQEITVSGTVTDAATGNPVPGVSVVQKNTTNGVATDFDGNYSIEVPNSSVLVYSALGYLTQEISVNGQSTIDVSLLEDASMLEEVVVTAYGTQKREEITSSIVSVDAEELTDVTVPNVSSMIQGKLTGVLVTPSSGSPGSVPQILIRGAASLGSNIYPLWVVDGVIQHSTPVVNPNDVGSISILKDASATALYGSRGANGVVIITTKKAKPGESRITYSGRTAASQFNDNKFEVMDSQQLYAYNESFNNSQPWFGPDLLERDFDWLGNGTRTGILQDHNLSFAAGTDKMNFYMNMGTFSEEGTIKGSGLERYTFRSNFDYQITDRLKIMPKLSLSFDKNDRQAQHSLYEMYLNLPWDIPFAADGTPINPDNVENWLGRDQSNYYYDLQWNYSQYKTYNTSGNFDFEFKLADALKFRSTNNFTLYESRSKSYTDPQSTGGQSTDGAISDNAARRLTRLTTQILEYAKQFDEHYFYLLAGYEYNDYHFESLGASGQGIIPGTSILNVAANPGSVSGFENDYALQSIFSLLRYNFDERIFFQGSVRRDGASNFGLDNQYGTFFSLGGTWNLHKEQFLEDTDAINELKIRVSYGSVGNRPGNLYPYQNTYSTAMQYLGIPATIPAQFGNSDLTWEKSFETNIGLDMRFFDRVLATVDVYNKNTSDLLYFVQLPDATGYSGFYENIGGLKNKGFEVGVYGSIIDTDDFDWDLGINVSKNVNEITELFEDQDEISVGGNKVLKIGEDIGTWRMRKWLGVDPENGDPLWEIVDPDTGERSETSDYSSATLQLVGTSLPDFTGGFNTGIYYKNFSLTSNFVFVEGGLYYNASRELFDSDGLYPTFNQQVFIDDWSRWQNPGDVATHPRAVEGGNNNSNKVSSRYLEDASYVRWNNLTVGYNLVTPKLKEFGVQNVNFFLSADNIKTWTKYSGPAPSIANSPVGGTSSLPYPLPRRYVLGLNITF